MSSRPDIGYPNDVLNAIELNAKKIANLLGGKKIEWVKPDSMSCGLKIIFDDEQLNILVVGFEGIVTDKDFSIYRYPLGRTKPFPRYWNDLDDAVNIVEVLLSRTMDKFKTDYPNRNAELVARFGMLIHDMYAKKYPISQRTKIQEIETDLSTHRYLKPLPATYPPSLVVAVPDRVVVEFEVWV